MFYESSSHHAHFSYSSKSPCSSRLELAPYLQGVIYEDDGTEKQRDKNVGPNTEMSPKVRRVSVTA